LSVGRNPLPGSPEQQAEINVGLGMDNGHVNIIKIDKLNTRVYYNLQEIGRPKFDMVLDDFVKKHNLG